MKTEALLKALALAKPSLGSNDAVLPILSHFIFLEDVVYAYNEMTAILVDETTGINAAMHGDTLLGLLQAGAGEEVEFDVKGNGIIKMKMAKGWAEIPAMSPEDSPFQLPEEEPILSLALTPSILAALERCLVSVSDDALKPEFAGVTVHIEKSAVTFLASDNKTASRYIPTGKFLSRKTASAVIPAQACDRLLKLAAMTGAGPGPCSLAIGTVAAVATFPGVTLVTRLLQAKPEALTRLFDEHFDGQDNVEIDGGLGAEIAKACVLTGRETEKQCIMRAKKGVVLLTATGTLGRMETRVKATGMEGPTAVNVDPTLVARVLPYVSAWGMSERCLRLSHEGFSHIISSGRVEEVAPPLPATTPRAAKAAAAKDPLDEDIPF